MDKEKEIEEMEDIISCCWNTISASKKLYNAGYRKVPDGTTVLLIGENNQALDEKTIEYFVKHNEQIRKEAVIDFAENLKEKLFSVFGKTICSELDTEDITLFIDELLREYEK